MLVQAAPAWRFAHRLSGLVASQDPEAEACVLPPQEDVLLLEVWDCGSQPEKDDIQHVKVILSSLEEETHGAVPLSVPARLTLIGITSNTLIHLVWITQNVRLRLRQ